jgi:hypothetical protein
MRTTFKLGDITIHRIVEMERGFAAPLTFLPDLTPEMLEENRAWLAPAALDADDLLVLCFQSFVVQRPITRFWSIAASATTKTGPPARFGTKKPMTSTCVVSPPMA